LAVLSPSTSLLASATSGPQYPEHYYYLYQTNSHSSIRQVPDHQEVYLDSSGFTSIIFDITERVGNVATDEEALKFHFDDIVSGSAEGTQYFHPGTATLAKMP
jgi:hypothetical protein